MGAWGVTWVGFNILALVITLIPYRRDERWAWFTLWTLPLLGLFQFVFSPDLLYLMLAVLSPRSDLFCLNAGSSLARKSPLA
jgi:hypothetical protein